MKMLGLQNKTSSSFGLYLRTVILLDSEKPSAQDRVVHLEYLGQLKILEHFQRGLKVGKYFIMSIVESLIKSVFISLEFYRQSVQVL